MAGEKGRILGVDYGERRIGLALTDPTQMIASPMTTLTVRSDDEAAGWIADLVVREDVVRVVLGMPLEKSGHEGAKAVKVKAFAAKLTARIAVPVVCWDERLSSVSAQRLLIESETKKKRRTKERIDTLAAVVILRHYLDYLERV